MQQLLGEVAAKVQQSARNRQFSEPGQIRIQRAKFSEPKTVGKQRQQQQQAHEQHAAATTTTTTICHC